MDVKISQQNGKWFWAVAYTADEYPPAGKTYGGGPFDTEADAHADLDREDKDQAKASDTEC